jgi:F-type H+-transporting ATPase subunit b
MPQFDLLSYPSQIFWLLMSLVLMIGVGGGVLLPRFANKMEKRQNFFDQHDREIKLLLEQHQHLTRSCELSIQQVRKESTRYLRKMLMDFESNQNQEFEKFEMKLQADLRKVQQSLDRQFRSIEKQLLQDTDSYVQLVLSKFQKFSI